MTDKRDRRQAIHSGSPPLCTTKATIAPLVARRPAQVTCKRCIHLLKGTLQ